MNSNINKYESKVMGMYICLELADAMYICLELADVSTQKISFL